ncbi:MAG TPA: helix-turn-helix transcriptional regulator [Gammaproteobacteria bacterium]|nr:helix-turn-helix transcriptional regulator [Gammaproteobacteria bacterium]
MDNSIASFKNKYVVDPRLAKKEISCLYWAAQGKSSEETAILLHLSKNTVETYRKRIKTKLNCRNMAHAVHKGIRCSCGQDPYI